MKFGGTSVADAEAMTRVVNIVRRRREAASGSAAPVVVVSALSKVTDGLIRTAHFAKNGEAAQATALARELLERHLRIASTLTSGARTTALVDRLRTLFRDLVELVELLAVKAEVTPGAHDAIVATGELASSEIVAAAFAEQGLPAVWVDARTVLVTNGDHTAAMPDMDATCVRMQERVVPIVVRGEIPVLGGFIGSTVAGVITTLGRGGSDYSASIFGTCIDAAEIQIWTDVDGMLTADPRVVSDPRVVPQLSFAEASELAYFGAKVLHPSTILPAVAKNIPVRILNSRRPENPGTLITAEGRPGGHLAALACKRDVTVIDITSSRMLMAHGFLQRLFEVFERFKTAVDVVTTSEVSVSVTVDDTRRLSEIVAGLDVFSEVVCEPKMAIISVVGERLLEDPALFGRAIVALGQIPLRMVSQAASRRNITFVMRDADVTEAMTRLHQAFF
jgi:aspartate kinase